MRTFTEEEVEEMMDSVVPEKPKTKADRIRSMSDEELAEFLEQFGTFNQPCNLSPGEPLKWLQSEVQ